MKLAVLLSLLCLTSCGAARSVVDPVSRVLTGANASDLFRARPAPVARYAGGEDPYAAAQRRIAERIGTGEDVR